MLKARLIFGSIYVHCAIPQFLAKIINIRNHKYSKLNNCNVMYLHIMCSAAAGERKNVSQSEKDQKSQWSHRGGGGRRILIGKRSRVNSCTKQQSSLVLEH